MATCEKLLPIQSQRSLVETSNRALPPHVLLARSLLWRSLRHGASDPLDVEESSTALLNATLDGQSERCASKFRASSRLQRSLERVKEEISVCPERKWTLDELAQVAHLSPYHLAHVFRRYAGTSAYRYVLRARLDRALNAVLDSDRSLADIAADSGFAHHSHFTARFRELFAITPDELRRRASTQDVAVLRKIVTAAGASAM